MWTTRADIFHILTTDSQKSSIPKNLPNKHRIYGTVKGGINGFYDIQYDNLPLDCNVVKTARGKLTVLKPNEVCFT